MPGWIIGNAAVALTGPQFLAVLVGASVPPWSRAVGPLQHHASRTRDSGLAPGFIATTGVGGPPVALAHQHADLRWPY